MAACTKSGSGDVSFSVLPPALMWAQRKDKLWITVALENCKNPTHDIKEKSFHFRGTGGTENQDHEVTLELYGEIDPAESKSQKSDRQLLYILVKKDASASYWPRLTKEQKKFHFLKTDFNRWKDEDDSEEEEQEDFNFDSMMNSMGGLNGGEFGGLPPEEAEDSDDEDLPELQ